MKKYKVTKQKVLKFSAEMEEEASIKLAIAEVCGANDTDIRTVMGGHDTISEKIKKKMITPEILYAMDKAIISILIRKDLDDAYNGTTWEYEGNIQGKTRYWYYCDEVDKWMLHKGSGHWDDLSNSLSHWKNILSYNSVAKKKSELNQIFKLIKPQKK
mgnify:FL=1